MGFFSRHVHKFNYRTNLLWCECGETQELPCLHDWHVHSEQQVVTASGKEQTQQVLKCITCGLLSSVNLTTGNVEYHEVEE